MKAIKVGSNYEIYDDSIQSFDQLPAKTFRVCFSKMTGFYLEEIQNIRITEKLYGVHLEKAEKVLKTFSVFDRSLGVILSGDKGIGKSAFAKLLSSIAMQRGIPVVVVDTFYPGIASYIDKIDQEVVILFDEYDKTFGGVKTADGDSDAQSGLLTLFDGLSVGKKLFVVTCNDLRSISSYMVNRPGRFHYHFRFEYPTSPEIVQYLSDKLQPEYHSEIQKVVSFAQRVDTNYDCLRAIAFELNTGSSFEEAVKDLNIIHLDRSRYDLYLYFEDGVVMNSLNMYIDMFRAGEAETAYFYDTNGENLLDVTFDPSDFKYDANLGKNILSPDNFKISYCAEDSSAEKWVKSLKPKYIIAQRKKQNTLHYDL